MSKSLADASSAEQFSEGALAVGPMPVMGGAAPALPPLPLDRVASQLEQSAADRTARLEETISELEAFSYSISHDMRSSLRVMQHYAQGLLEDYGAKLDSEGIGALTRIHQTCSRLDVQIRELLLYSRIAKSEIKLKPISLGPLVENLIEQHAGFAEVRHCFKVEQPLHKVKGNEAYLIQCFTNLLGNALKFVSPGNSPEIHVRSERESGKVCVRVSDNGIGIAQDQSHRIFQLFGRVHPESVYPGTGLGLAIVKKAI